LRAALAALLLGAVALSGEARLIEEKRWIPARAIDAKGAEVAHDIMVTIFYDDDAPKPWPVMIINHGRAGKAADRAALGRAGYYDISRWFVEKGFIVAVPTRMGYGVTGGPDVENTGACTFKVYAAGYEASAAQTLTVLEYLRGWKEVAKDRAVILGQSFGGTTAITIAAKNTPGVQATINFAGGGGGDPKAHPQKPCGGDRLTQMFAQYGTTARLPTLWIYSENDQYFGPKWPKTWFAAYRKAGGPGEFEQYPPVGEDGHPLFTLAPKWWQPRVLTFLRANGYPNL
jgi:dienelactone hydrolase